MADNGPYFLRNASQMGVMMRRHDWSKSPLGVPSTWPHSLCTVVGLMLDSKFPMFLAWGPELILLYNDAYIDALRDKHPAALGRPFQEIWREIWSDLLPAVTKALAGQATFFENMPLLMNRKGYDEQTWFTFSYSPIHIETGAIAGLYCACTETTSQVLGERNHVAENERLKRLFQQAPGYITITRGPEHRFELANDSYYTLVGKRELIGKTAREAFPELVNQGFYELLDDVFKSGKPFIGRAVPIKLVRDAENGLEQRFIDFVNQPIRNLQGEITGIFVEGSDVTESVVTARAVRASELKLRQLANTMPNLAWMANPDGYIHWYNDRWYEFTGTSEEQMLGWGWESVHDPEFLPKVVETWKASLVSGESWELTFPLRSADGTFRTFFTRAAPLKDENGDILQWFGTNTDVTEIKDGQDQLRAANERKDDFLAMLAHELRNPLAPINAAADLLLLSKLDENRVKQTATIISRQVAHMTKLVDDLLDVSRVTRGLVTLSAHVLNMNDVVADALEQVQAQIQLKEHHLLVRTTSERCFVKGDRTRLIQILANLLSNAARYTPSGGEIGIDISASLAKVIVSVSDNGIGIAPTLKSHVFDLFAQGDRSSDRAQGGLGLGLALVKRLVELHAGSVSLNSQGVGQGCVFTIELPRISEDGALYNADPAIEDISLSTDLGLSLMVVDDNDDAAQMLSLLLETLGHRVWVANNATDALKTAQAKSPSVLFLDIGLPDMDGYELARRLRTIKETSSALLVAVTGYGQPEDKVKALQAGFDHHIVKPVRLSALTALLHSID